MNANTVPNPIDDLEQELPELIAPLDYKIQVMAFLLACFGLILGSKMIQVNTQGFLAVIPGVSFSNPIKSDAKSQPKVKPDSKDEQVQTTAPSSAPAVAPAKGGNYEEVMDFILKWEGGCSDDPDDAGGRTHMGITTEVARRNGWSGDVCAMPKSKVMEIYKKDYWNPIASKYDWPLTLPIMNVSVNGGLGRAREHLSEMPKSITDPWDQSLWLARRMQTFYDRIIENKPRQKKFHPGWTNRNNDMIGRLEAGKKKWQGKIAQPPTN